MHNPKKVDLCLKTLRNNTCMDTASKIEEKAHKQRRDSFTWHSHNSMKLNFSLGHYANAPCVFVWVIFFFFLPH